MTKDQSGVQSVVKNLTGLMKRRVVNEMDENRINLATDIYLKSYTRALNECHNPNLAVQCAMSVVMVLMQPQQQQQQVNPLLSFLIQSQKNAQKKSTKNKSDDEGEGD